MEQETFDYVIVGGGSAGCVLANRLSADGKRMVCLLEAGPPDKTPAIKMPSGVIPLMRSRKYNWRFWTAPQPNLKNRRLYWPRGKTLGGSSSINAMVYIRGNRDDYDNWAALGNDGWSYDELLPYFRKHENHERGADEYHGAGGPLNVADRRDAVNPLTHVFVAAAQQAGYRPNPDFNGAQQEGFGYYEVMQKGGQRCSNARAYLRGAEKRRNLMVVTQAHATKVLFDGKRAVGVRYRHKGAEHEVRARHEVILAAGTIGSPHLLLLSGVGPREELARHGIETVHDLPGVGRNLQDHLDVLVCVREKTRLAASFHWRTLWRTLKALFQYLFFRRGEFTSNVAEAGGFLKSAPHEPRPDLQMHFVPIVNAHHGLDLRGLFRYYGYSILTCDLRPISRGRITLESADPLAPPRIDPNYLSDPRELDKLVAAVKRARAILAQPAFEPHRLEELEPGPQVQTVEQLRDWVRANAETIYHPVGTCKMGGDDEAVVDARLRVRGLEALRVVDASIMPVLVAGNTNAPTTAVAEKGADMILEDALAAATETSVAVAA